MHRVAALHVLVFALIACAPTKPIRTASGEMIDGVSIEERFPLSPDAHEVSFHGDKLRKAVELLDQHGVIALTGSYEPAKNVLDKGTVTVVFHSPDNRQRTIVVKNCAEPHVCAFFADALKSGITERAPVVCRDAVACIKK